MVEVTGERFSLNMIGTIDMLGKLRFMVVKGTVSSQQICDFLTRLMHGAQEPIFLIWVGQPTLTARIVQECVCSFGGSLEVYTLPSYSPELNPVERVWINVKHQEIGRKKVFGPDQMKLLLVVVGVLRRVQKQPSLVKAFFRHPDCCYTLL